MPDNPMDYIHTCKSTGEVYAAAYGYLTVMLDQYIQRNGSFQQLAEEYVDLQAAVAEALERIMERHRRRTAEVATGHATVTVTTDPLVAKAIQDEDPDSIVLDTR